jgi:hypothetical protein
MSFPYPPSRNFLLQALPPLERETLLAHLRPTALSVKTVLFEPGEAQRQVTRRSCGRELPYVEARFLDLCSCASLFRGEASSLEARPQRAPRGRGSRSAKCFNTDG